MIQLNEKRVVTKGNIPINNKLLNKYNSAEEIFKCEKSKSKNKIFVKNDIKELNNINLSNMKIKEIKNLAYHIFGNHHTNLEFINAGNKILVNRSGLNESIEKIYYNRLQRELLEEHLLIFAKLGKIIERAILVNQVYERKNRIKYNSWNYYVEGIIISNKEYILEFEVVSMSNGKNI